jgi:hypothetical protein
LEAEITAHWLCQRSSPMDRQEISLSLPHLRVRGKRNW